MHLRSFLDVIVEVRPLQLHFVFKMGKVLIFGTFDHLHPGHLDFFRQAKELGGYLTVVVARDATVQNVKGHLPRKNENERLADVKNCKIADEVVLGNLDDPYAIIKKISPNIIALGYDQNSFSDGLPEFIKKNNLKIEIVRLKPYCSETCKSSLMNKK